MAILLSDYLDTKHKGLFIHKSDSSKFLFNFRINGKATRQVFNANPAHTKADKLKTAYIKLEELKGAKVRVESSGANLVATVDEYFDRLQLMTERNEETQKSYKLHYERYIKPTIGRLKITSVTAMHISTITALTKHLANSTRQKSTAILVPIFRLAIDEELIQFSPVKHIHKIKRKQLEEKKVISNAETKYREVYKAINDVFADNHKIRALFLFGFYGRRKTEALHLKWSDIDFVNDSYTIRGVNSKINTDMSFKLPQDVKAALLECEKFSSYIFASDRDPLKPISEIREHVEKVRAATVPEYNFHWMRNLSVSALSSMGVEAIHLSAMLGHTDTATVKQYLSLQRESSSVHTLDASKRLLGE
ncbi:MAG: tyrosine-type recombinase/integrase [Sulfurimonas sp.]|uniref:tyrosine-type recombinase/integrase n=1 Tax=Sulfurimonas sp. TaxID=2022749 RepID=UPI002639A168|nr:tyrosine-type recombinase/integrase [Sulfurimonas sp.]MDD5372216.1 tyrosine-type recombinase/integrase [Sulfurimonas sp.]